MNIRKALKWTVGVAVALFVTLAVLGAVLDATGHDNAPDKLPPCKSETDTHCYWDASEHGNGRGHDFVAP